MAKITIQIPEPKSQYSQEDQRQILQAFRTLQSHMKSSTESEEFSMLVKFVFDLPVYIYL